MSDPFEPVLHSLYGTIRDAVRGESNRLTMHATNYRVLSLSVPADTNPVVNAVYGEAKAVMGWRRRIAKPPGSPLRRAFRRKLP